VSSSSESDRLPPDTAQHLQAARAGSGEAFGRLLDTCRQYLLLVANQQLPADVQGKVGPSDLVQETFLKAHRNFAQFHGDSEEELRAWLRQILLNTLANVLRQYRRTGSREVGREVRLAADDPVAPRQPGLPAEAPPGDGLVAEEEAEALRRALAQLPEEYRQVIQWRNWERRPFEEIGRLLGRSPEAARKLWGRAVDRLGQILEGPNGP
jgi:RNA polymerase sigma-70 factor (ECF subfamily)